MNENIHRYDLHMYGKNAYHFLQHCLKGTHRCLWPNAAEYIEDVCIDEGNQVFIEYDAYYYDRGKRLTPISLSTLVFGAVQNMICDGKVPGNLKELFALDNSTLVQLKDDTMWESGIGVVPIADSEFSLGQIKAALMLIRESPLKKILKVCSEDDINSMKGNALNPFAAIQREKISKQIEELGAIRNCLIDQASSEIHPKIDDLRLELQTRYEEIDKLFISRRAKLEAELLSLSDSAVK